MAGHAHFFKMGNIGNGDQLFFRDLFGEFAEPGAQDHPYLRRQRATLFYEIDSLHDTLIMIHTASLYFG
jgi:hypothetical protein